MSRPFVAGQLLTADDLNIAIRFEGDGSDGDVIISVDTDLTRDMYYNNFTVNSGKILNTKGYRIFCKETLTNEGIIRNNGSAGNIGPAVGCDSGSRGGDGGAGGVGNYFRAGTIGGKGGQGQCHFAGDTTPPTPDPVVNSVGGDGATGGNSTVKGLAIIYDKILTAFELKTGSSGYGRMYVAGAGGGGAGGAGEYGGDGGGAGGSGGFVGIYAKYLINNGVIQTLGGIGGAGRNVSSPTSDGGSGGAGGNGGVLMIVYRNKTGSGTLSVAGGSGGAGGTGTRNNGFAGSTGNAGVLVEVARD